MKYRKTIGITLLVLGLVALGVHLYRDSIAMRVANAALSGANVTVSDVSVESIGTDTLRFARIVLDLDGGGEIVIEGISLPARFRGFAGSTLTVDKVRVIASDEDAGPIPLADGLRAYLDAPTLLPDVTVEIRALDVDPFPTIENLQWQSTDTGSKVDAAVAEFHVSIVTAGDESVVLQAMTADDTVAANLEATLTIVDGGYRIDTDARFETAPLLPVARSLGIVPENLATLDGAVIGSISVDIDADPGIAVPIHSILSIVDTVDAQYVTGVDTTIGAHILEASPFNLSLSYPALDWVAITDRISSEMTLLEFEGLPVELADLVCEHGISCSFLARSSLQAVSYGNALIQEFHFSAPVTYESASTTTVVLAPESNLALSGVTMNDITAATVNVVPPGGIHIFIDDSGWVVSSEQMTLTVGELRRDKLAATFTADLGNVAIDDRSGIYEATFEMPSYLSEFAVTETSIVAPDVSGSIVYEEGMVAALARLSSSDGGLNSDLNLVVEASTGNGRLEITDSVIDFGLRRLSSNVYGWPHNWDVIGGLVAIDANLKFDSGDDGLEYTGNIGANVSAISGNYGDVAFVDLDTTLHMTFVPGQDPDVADLQVGLASLDIGLPLTDIHAVLAPDLATRSVNVRDASLTLLGGALRADPFTFAPEADSNEIMLRIKSVQLPLMVGLAGFDSIDISGTVSGQVPVTIKGNRVLVSGGHLESDAPGGAIRYGAAGALVDPDDDSHLGIAMRALSNFEFETLTSDVSYTEEGDLELQMRMTGTNPETNPDQPVILNLGVNNNIPQLLRSLQATRTIGEILERRLSQ